MSNSTPTPWLNKYDDPENLNGSNGVNNEDIRQIALWSGFNERTALCDIRLGHFYAFVEAKIKRETNKENT
jgi:hypothetical protein